MRTHSPYRDRGCEIDWKEAYGNFLRGWRNSVFWYGFGLHRCTYLSNLNKWTFKIYTSHCVLKVFPPQPTDWTASRITSIVPESSLAKDQCTSIRQCQQPYQKWYSQIHYNKKKFFFKEKKVIFPRCLMFFCSSLSLHGSLRAVMFEHVCSEQSVPL